MPVKRILYWEPNEGSSINSQIVEEATKCIKENFNGDKEGIWEPTTVSYYKPILQDRSKREEFPKEFVEISLGDEPSKYYYVIRREKLVVEADSSMQTIMTRLDSYQPGLSFLFEGCQYKAGDFQFRIGKVVPTFDSQDIVGIIMEIDYLPISSMETAKFMMEGFVEMWQEEMSKRSSLGKFVNRTVKFAEFGLSDTTHRNTQLFNMLTSWLV